MELLLVRICVLCGDMAGDGWRELDAMDETLMAEAGIEVADMWGRLVWTLESFARRASGDCTVGCEGSTAIVGISVDIVGDDVAEVK
jgi:hypothetical protein